MEKKTNKPTVAAYARFATKQQLNNPFADCQSKRLLEFCKEQGWSNIRLYFDNGYSGISLDRPQMQRLIKDSKANKIDKVIVLNLCRLSRNTVDTVFLLQNVFQRNNIELISLLDNFDTSSSCIKPIIDMISSFSR